MVPIVAVPHMQASPPVETSLFTGNIAHPAIGRLPVHVVPPPIDNPEVADYNRQQQQGRQGNQPQTRQAAPSVPGSALPAAQGRVTLDMPFSTTFMAQIYGQTPAGGSNPLFGAFIAMESMIAYGNIKYMPSLAFRPLDSGQRPQAQESGTEARAVATQNKTRPSTVENTSGGEIVVTVQQSPARQENIILDYVPSVTDDDTAENASVEPSFSARVRAYTDTASRNLASVVESRSPEVSLIL